MRKIFVNLIALVVLVGGAALLWQKLATNFLEKDPPSVVFGGPSNGIGIDQSELSFTASDSGQGLAGVVVRLFQKGMPKTILERNYQGEKTVTEKIQLGKFNGLAEGPVRIEVRAFDASFFSNGITTSLEIEVDLHRPSLEMISSQHNARRGGSQLVVYRAKDSNLFRSGVIVGGQEYLGFPASSVSEDLNDSELFMVLYALPISSKVTQDSLLLFAEDQVGNRATTGFYNRIAERQIRDIAISAPDSAKFLQQIIFDSTDTPLQKFAERFVSAGGVVRAGFGERVTLFGENSQTSTMVLNGIEMRMDAGTRQVRVVAFGKVQAVVDDQIGKAVIVHHGLGLRSIYRGLLQTAVTPGELLNVGEPLGTAGITALGSNPGVFFEIAVGPTFVDPREWFDQRWFESHIQEKIRDTVRVYRGGDTITSDSVQ